MKKVVCIIIAAFAIGLVLGCGDVYIPAYDDDQILIQTDTPVQTKSPEEIEAGFIIPLMKSELEACGITFSEIWIDTYNNDTIRIRMEDKIKQYGNLVLFGSYVYDCMNIFNQLKSSESNLKLSIFTSEFEHIFVSSDDYYGVFYSKKHGETTTIIMESIEELKKEFPALSKYLIGLENGLTREEYYLWVEIGYAQEEDGMWELQEEIIYYIIAPRFNMTVDEIKEFEDYVWEKLYG
ncbi:MAG: hypothetical protein FWE69_04420 [Clostridiales bacterium]|nr:hypothetical protein [Clostridiales bacterium]